MHHFPRNTGKFLPKYKASCFRKNMLFSAVMFWTSLNVSYVWSRILHFLNSSASGYCGSQGKSTGTVIPFIAKYLIFKSINVRHHGGRIKTRTMEIFQSNCHNKSAIYLFISTVFFFILSKALVRTGVSASHVRMRACLRMCVYAVVRARARMRI